MEPLETTERRNPWSYIPLMYFLQAIPVALVGEVASIVYKDLGVANESITRWTSIVALPWALQMFFGPLVELSSTRRRWFTRAQLVIAAVLVVLPFLLRTPAAFELSLGAFLVSAIFSTICNAAQDGYYLLALSKSDQARFAGIQGTFYKLGTLFAKGLLVFLAGKLMAFSSVEIRTPEGLPAWRVGTSSMRPIAPLITVKGGALVDQSGTDAAPGLRLSPDVRHLEIQSDGKIVSEGAIVGQLKAASVGAAQIDAAMSPRNAWTAVLLLGGLLYLALYALERRTIPYPPEDREVAGSRQEQRADILRTVAIVILGIAAYFTANAAVRLGAHTLWSLRDGTPDGPLKGWRLANDAHLSVVRVPGPGVVAEFIQLAFCAVVALAAFTFVRRTIRGTAMGQAFGSFFQQAGLPGILAFLMFYRFGEAMIMKMSPLFLKDAPSAGGLGLGTDQVGAIKGMVGVFGIILGGILGGWIVSRVGLRRSIWPLAICMHIPGLLYLWASHAHPLVEVMFVVDFVEQFGYGFGYAGYTVILQRIAQRGSFRTAHYALGVGVGALFTQVAGVLSGVLQSNFGYTGLFAAAVGLAIPGLATLLFLPLDETS